MGVINVMEEDDENYNGESHLFETKDRGITWLLEIRIILGVGVLIIIILVALCCYWLKKEDKSLYHKEIKQISSNYRFDEFYHNYNVDEFGIRDHPNSLPASNESSVPIPEYDADESLNHLNASNEEIFIDPRSPRNIPIVRSDKTDKMDTKQTENNEKNTNPTPNPTAIDILPLNPVQKDRGVIAQSEISAVRQLLNLRKIMMTQRKMKGRNDAVDASDICSVSTNDILHRKTSIVSMEDDESVQSLKFRKYSDSEYKKNILHQNTINTINVIKPNTVSHIRKKPIFNIMDHEQNRLSETEMESQSESNELSMTTMTKEHSSIPIFNKKEENYDSSTYHDQSTSYDPIPTAC